MSANGYWTWLELVAEEVERLRRRHVERELSGDTPLPWELDTQVNDTITAACEIDTERLRLCETPLERMIRMLNEDWN